MNIQLLMMIIIVAGIVMSFSVGRQKLKLVYQVRSAVRWPPRSEAQLREGASWPGFRCAVDAAQARLGENAEAVNRRTLFAAIDFYLLTR